MDDDRRIAELQRRERLLVRSQTKALVDAAASGDEETFYRFGVVGASRILPDRRGQCDETVERALSGGEIPCRTRS
jgi:hypothetical protein